MVADCNADSRRLSGRRGIALISAYMVLSLILIYSGGMTKRAGTGFSLDWSHFAWSTPVLPMS